MWDSDTKLESACAYDRSSSLRAADSSHPVRLIKSIHSCTIGRYDKIALYIILQFWPGTITAAAESRKPAVKRGNWNYRVGCRICIIIKKHLGS